MEHLFEVVQMCCGELLSSVSGSQPAVNLAVKYPMKSPQQHGNLATWPKMKQVVVFLRIPHKSGGFLFRGNSLCFTLGPLCCR